LTVGDAVPAAILSTRRLSSACPFTKRCGLLSTLVIFITSDTTAPYQDLALTEGAVISAQLALQGSETSRGTRESSGQKEKMRAFWKLFEGLCQPRFKRLKHGPHFSRAFALCLPPLKMVNEYAF
jgi:hypothetical protein